MLDAAERHEEISRVTGLAPTTSHVRGDRRFASSDWLYENDIWILKSSLPGHANMSAHLRWLWDRIGPHAHYFRSLVGEGVEVDVWCSYITDCDHCGFTLEPDAAEIARSLGVPLHVSTVFVGRDDEAG